MKVTWDEPNLEETSQLRGTRTKITEPKTPFIHYDSNSDEIIGNSSGVPVLELTNAIMDLDAHDEKDAFEDETRQEKDDFEDDSGRDELRERNEKKEFEKKRAMHYKVPKKLEFDDEI